MKRERGGIRKNVSKRLEIEPSSFSPSLYFIIRNWVRKGHTIIDAPFVCCPDVDPILSDTDCHIPWGLYPDLDRSDGGAFRKITDPMAFKGRFGVRFAYGTFGRRPRAIVLAIVNKWTRNHASQVDFRNERSAHKAAANLESKGKTINHLPAITVTTTLSPAATSPLWAGRPPAVGGCPSAFWSGGPCEGETARAKRLLPWSQRDSLRAHLLPRFGVARKWQCF